MATHIIGDLHGYHQVYRQLLRAAGLITADDQWSGGSDTLWLIGDLFDRGESGIDCLDLTMALQQQARTAGGDVNCVLGNHEMMILAAARFGETATRHGYSFNTQWQHWGGQPADLKQLTTAHVQWLQELPALVSIDDNLLMHADATFYLDHGMDVVSVNDSFRALLRSDDPTAWESNLGAFAEHGSFSDLPATGTRRAAQIAQLYGARRLIHGHTPIPYARNIAPESVTGAWEYAQGACINVDGGIYMGGPGFVFTLD